MKKKYSLSVTEFAISAPRQGSIDTHSGFGNDKTTGQEIHYQTQFQRQRDFPEYDSEVSVAHQFFSMDNTFKVSGRIDGIFRREQPLIEEIKSSFNIRELQRYIKKNIQHHPYCLQLQTYGYMHWIKHQELPLLNLHLVSSRKRESVDISIDLNIDDYEKWLALRLADLDKEIKLAQKTIQRRTKYAKLLEFPFPQPRRGQVELIATIETNQSVDQPSLIQAPTGLGKTIGVLYPTLKEALLRGQKVVYVTPKNSQHAVAEDAIDRLHTSKASIKSLTLTAKSKLCLKGEPICNSQYCEFAENHYTKISANDLTSVLDKKRKLTAKTFTKLAKEFQVCPFELQFEAVKKADVVICDYNYVFAPRAGLGRVASNFIGIESKPNLIIDEIHNLPSRGMDYYSPTLSVSLFTNILKQADKLAANIREEAFALISRCIEIIENCRTEELTLPCKISPPVEVFVKHDNKLRDFLMKYLSSDTDITADDLIMRFCYYWSEFTKVLEFIVNERDEFFTTLHANPTTIKITCCDASEMLKPAYDDFKQVVGFSATLKPFNYYSQLTGLRSGKLQTKEFPSPFSTDKRKIIIIPQISTKYSNRTRSYPRIAEVITKVTALKKGNYLVFFPSFEFLDKTAAHFYAGTTVRVIQQRKGMTKKEVNDVLVSLQHPTQSSIIFAVQGGIFSEGIDYPGDMAIGVFVVGPPLPTFDLESDHKRQYYQQKYAAGFDYAYIYPAMAKAVQSAGRVIRSETDKGLIVLIDDRFTQPSYTTCMPEDWFDLHHRELISQSILSDITTFWTND
jgi:DNA excision repair protein ERCC-2